MKSNKAHRRILKVEALISDLVNRFSTGSTHVTEAIQSAKAAVTRAREAVASEESPGTSGKATPSGKAAKKKSKKSTAGGKKSAAKKSTVKPAEASSERRLVRKPGKKRTTVPEE